MRQQQLYNRINDKIIYTHMSGKPYSPSSQLYLLQHSSLTYLKWYRGFPFSGDPCLVSGVLQQRNCSSVQGHSLVGLQDNKTLLFHYLQINFVKYKWFCNCISYICIYTSLKTGLRWKSNSENLCYLPMRASCYMLNYQMLSAIFEQTDHRSATRGVAPCRKFTLNLICSHLPCSRKLQSNFSWVFFNWCTLF